MIVILGVLSTGLFFINYPLGFAVLGAFSMTHVLLEFPLNVICIRDLGRLIGRRGLPVNAIPGVLPDR
jgi:hypothetical protein